MLLKVKTTAEFRQALAVLALEASHPPDGPREVLVDGSVALTGGPVLKRSAFSTIAAWNSQAQSDALFYQAARMNMLPLVDDVNALAKPLEMTLDEVAAWLRHETKDQYTISPAETSTLTIKAPSHWRVATLEADLREATLTLDYAKRRIVESESHRTKRLSEIEGRLDVVEAVTRALLPQSEHPTLEQLLAEVRRLRLIEESTKR